MQLRYQLLINLLTTELHKCFLDKKNFESHCLNGHLSLMKSCGYEILFR